MWEGKKKRIHDVQFLCIHVMAIHVTIFAALVDPPPPHPTPTLTLPSLYPLQHAFVLLPSTNPTDKWKERQSVQANLSSRFKTDCSSETPRLSNPTTARAVSKMQNANGLNPTPPWAPASGLTGDKRTIADLTMVPHGLGSIAHCTGAFGAIALELATVSPSPYWPFGKVSRAVFCL